MTVRVRCLQSSTALFGYRPTLNWKSHGCRSIAAMRRSLLSTRHLPLHKYNVCFCVYLSFVFGSLRDNVDLCRFLHSRTVQAFIATVAASQPSVYYPLLAMFMTFCDTIDYCNSLLCACVRVHPSQHDLAQPIYDIKHASYSHCECFHAVYEFGDRIVSSISSPFGTVDTRCLSNLPARARSCRPTCSCQLYLMLKFTSHTELFSNRPASVLRSSVP